MPPTTQSADIHLQHLINQFAVLVTEKSRITIDNITVDEDDDPQASQAQHLIPLIQAPPQPKPDGDYPLGLDKSARAGKAASYLHTLEHGGTY